jgi:hypothetical protein
LAEILALWHGQLVKLSLGTALAFFVAGCGLIPGLSSGGSGGSSSSGSGGSSSTPGGTNCGTDPETGAVLCLGNSACPGLTIDTEVYPGCGFRIAGSAVDIECSCNGFLCPLGATSCDDAKTKLMNENYGVVCAQASGGSCVQGMPVASSSSSGGSSTCDPTCRDECAGEPTCLQQCGC